MKHNKHIHDEDYDINIKLMVPLLSMLVCTICLCATTWAWYTASVSTGVNSIVAGVNVTVTAKIGESDAPFNNGAYTLRQGETLTLTFTGNNAANGYYALIDINDPDNTLNLSESIINLFVNRVYAEEATTQGITKAIYFNEGKKIEITNDESNTKIVTVAIVWANPVIENGIIKGHCLDKQFNYETIEQGEEIQIIIQEESVSKVLIAHFYDVETQKPLPSDSQETETYNLEETEDTGLVGIYEFEGTTCEVKAPEGYMIVVKNEQGEDAYVESVIYDNLPEEETTEVTIFCISKEKLNTENKETPSETVDVPEEGSSDIETTDSTDNQTIDAEENASNSLGTNNEIATPSDGSTESKTETGASESGVTPVEGNEGENIAEDTSGSSTGNNEGSTTSEQQTGTSDTVESLLVTDTTSNEETSSDTQSADSSSSSEIESNVSE